MRKTCTLIYTDPNPFTLTNVIEEMEDDGWAVATVHSYMTGHDDTAIDNVIVVYERED